MKILHYGIVLLFMVTLWGCSQGNSSAPVTIDPTTKKHPVGWAINGTGGTHPLAYFAAPASCQSCHGLPSDPKGGISGVSCSNPPGRSGVACHPAFPHAIGFVAFVRHGSVAKDVASGATGMAHCKQCHGSDYTGGEFAPSCVKCHNNYNASNSAPHAANWLAGNVNGLKHSTTNPTNAAACAQCHSGGNLSPIAPPSPPPAAGTAPGCFNGTLCHYDAGHTFKVADHQQPARSNLASCQTCHGTPSSGLNPRYTVPKNATLTPNGCEKCHNRPGIAHPYMWLPGRGTTNGNANTTNHKFAGTVIGSCGLCHGGSALTGGSFAYPGGIAPPSCFPASSINGTVCHFTKPVDAQGVSVGCVSCHATPPDSKNPPTIGFPNRSAGHYRHWKFPGIIASGGCTICHQGGGAESVTHANGTVKMSSPTLPTKFQNVSGTVAIYNTGTGTCSNVSCHGNFLFSAQPWTNTAPVLDPTLSDQVLKNSYCYYCHKVSTAVAATIVGVPFPYIGPFSGRVPQYPLDNGNNLHQAHLVKFNVYCMDCHTLNVHYNSLMQGRRILVAGFAAPSVGGTGTSVITYTAGNGSPGTGSCSTIIGASALGSGTTCHPNTIRTWY